eukprot:TRINITY_DN3022_c0_g4_i1.p1 TRINITY_DN3022_c0_g4~~TRINITY_DN3022_c0_g4_i1.p1  ORF type:complete len:208 (+),score=110.78 TRINITY_DN3022_c0_g4_i1:46-624(+)
MATTTIINEEQKEKEKEKKMKIGILTISDRCSRGESEDLSGRCIVELVKEQFGNDKIEIEMKIVADEVELIKETLIDWCDNLKLNLILTTGGTGFAPRDVTPEATKQVIQKETPGLVFAMTKKSLEITEFAILSRQTAGIRKESLIINFPGKPQAVIDCYNAIKRVLPHALSLLQDDPNASKPSSHAQGNKS